MNDEINTLELERQRLKTAMGVLRMPESIAGECLTRRTARLERDLVRDKAEEELIKVQYNDNASLLGCDAVSFIE
jgi:tektin-4